MVGDDDFVIVDISKQQAPQLAPQDTVNSIVMESLQLHIYNKVFIPGF